MCFAMLKKTIFASGVLAMLICLPFTVHAASDSTSIGISVVIKSKQTCDYSYAMETNAQVRDLRNTGFSVCDISAAKLQQQANQIASSSFTTTQSQLDEKRLRIFIAV